MASIPPKKALTKQPDLTIVIPAYCEEKRIGATLEVLGTFLTHDAFFSDKAVETLVVAADAPDRTHDIVLSKRHLFKQFQLLKPGPGVGKGRDVCYGMLRASGKLVVFMDADMATPLHHLENFYKACVSGSDIVIGIRDFSTYRSSKLRCWFAGFGNKLYRLASAMPFEDTQCGFKMFRADACTRCFSKLTILGWGFDLEILAIAQANRLHTTQLLIDDWHDMPFGTYRDGVLTIAARTIRDFAHVAKHRLNGSYINR